MAEYFDLGDYSRKVTSNNIAQTWFNRGMVWLFAYNHEEAIFCFEKAVKADQNCTFAYWGIAYAIGPNYNKAWDVFTLEEKAPALHMAHKALSAAQKIGGAPSIERELIDALVHRYPKSADIEDFEPYNDAFAAAMKPIYEKNSKDLDVACIYAEALMNRTPWRLWDFGIGVPNPQSSTGEAMEVLSAVSVRKRKPGIILDSFICIFTSWRCLLILKRL